MSNILLVNDNVQDYQTIIDACKDNTYPITYNQNDDTYDSILKKYENIVIENNIQVVNHLALVSHGNINPEFTFLEKENKMLISQYLPDLSNSQENDTIVNDLSLYNLDITSHNTDMSLDKVHDLSDNINIDISEYIIDSVNLTNEEFNTKDFYTIEDIRYIFKDTSCNILKPIYDLSLSDQIYSRQTLHYLIMETYYKTRDTSDNYTLIKNETDNYENSISFALTTQGISITTNNNVNTDYTDNNDNTTNNPDITSNYSPTDIEYVLPESSINGRIINNLYSWNAFKEFIKKFNIQTSLDFLGCALLQSSDWKYTLNMLETPQHLNLKIRASDDNTGNLKVGGDWVLESDNVNIKELYFDRETIEKWSYILGHYQTQARVNQIAAILNNLVLKSERQSRLHDEANLTANQEADEVFNITGDDAAAAYWYSQTYDYYIYNNTLVGIVNAGLVGIRIAQTNIKFSDLYVGLLNNGSVPSTYPNISFTSIRNTAFSPHTGNAIPSSGPISIGSDFKGRIFVEPPLSIENARTNLTDANLNAMYTALTGANGTMYNINNHMSYGNTYISDGGHDIYDVGNRIRTNLAQDATYTNTITSWSGIANNRYFVKIGPNATNRFFILVMDLFNRGNGSTGTNPTYIKIYGNLGADNQGTRTTGNMSGTFNTSTTWKVYWTSVHDGQVRDPSLHHIWIVKDVTGVSFTNWQGTSTGYENEQINLPSSGAVDRLYYIMWCGARNDGHTNSTEVNAVTTKFLEVVGEQ